MKCKNCGSENVVALNDYYSTNPYALRVKCQDCGCKFDILTNQIDTGEAIMQEKNTYITISPIKKTIKLLIVEDGSIDAENCEQDLLNMGIKLLVYRRGSQPPKLYDLGE